MSEPMSDEQWVIVRQQIEKLTTYVTPSKEHAEVIGLLTDEVERLRAENAAIREREAAARIEMHAALEDVRSLRGVHQDIGLVINLVAEGDFLTSLDNGGDIQCNVCGAMLGLNEAHEAICIVTVARAIKEYLNGKQQ